MKQPCPARNLEQTDNDPRSYLSESCRQWLETAGDIDDFIFYQTEQKISQR
ncbi:hypothetical protein [uncultured Negativibacillus sp.]|uniref:hypothetical protein n=1 Tax=uncultured Negativibacillus sp. TaxID=1980696 RepID=UPI0025D1AF56|nr:hypothetical protein [uncultured Negativibacillus sp.]